MAIFQKTKSPTEIALRASSLASGENDELYAQLLARKESTDAGALHFAAMCQRADDLYYATDITEGGADHWADHKTAKTKGLVHISMNDPHVFVDVPAYFIAIPPDLDYIPDSASKEDQEDADRREKLMWTWWIANDMDTLMESASRVCRLYGVVILQPYWDGEMPRVRLIETPSDLRIGWGASDYSRKDWGMRLFSLSPQAVKDEYGLDTRLDKIDGQTVAIVGRPTEMYTSLDSAAVRSEYEQTQVQVYDYWYKSEGKVRNALYVGNFRVHDDPHPEFDDIPFIWIANGKLPGRPYGRGELYDVEQVIREYDEAITRAGQVQHGNEPMWQLNGPTASKVPAGLKPIPNGIVAPGPGNAINPVSPWMPAFQVEEFLKRLDDAKTRITGVNDTLLNMRTDASGSSKALRTEISMFVPRISLKRRMFYQGMILEHWRVAAKMWERKTKGAKKDLGKIIDGHYDMTITPPELVDMDPLEQINAVVTAIQNGAMSLRTGMKRIGIMNPTEEMMQVMSEFTNGALHADKVTMQLQLLQMAKSLQVAPADVAQAGGETLSQGAVSQAMNLQRSGTPPPAGSPSVQQPGVPAASSLPPNAQEGGTPLTSQTMISNGEMSGRILSSSEVK